MLTTILELLPKVTAAVAALPEFARHIKAVKDTLSEDDQATLQTAYELAKQGSDEAFAELDALVAARTA